MQVNEGGLEPEYIIIIIILIIRAAAAVVATEGSTVLPIISRHPSLAAETTVLSHPLHFH